MIISRPTSQWSAACHAATMTPAASLFAKIGFRFSAQTVRKIITGLFPRSIGGQCTGCFRSLMSHPLEGDALSSPQITPRRRQSVALHYGSYHGRSSLTLIDGRLEGDAPSSPKLTLRRRQSVALQWSAVFRLQQQFRQQGLWVGGEFFDPIKPPLDGSRFPSDIINLRGSLIELLLHAIQQSAKLSELILHPCQQAPNFTRALLNRECPESHLQTIEECR